MPSPPFQCTGGTWHLSQIFWTAMQRYGNCGVEQKILGKRLGWANALAFNGLWALPYSRFGRISYCFGQIGTNFWIETGAYNPNNGRLFGLRHVVLIQKRIAPAAGTIQNNVLFYKVDCFFLCNCFFLRQDAWNPIFKAHHKRWVGDFHVLILVSLCPNRIPSQGFETARYNDFRAEILLV